MFKKLINQSIALLFAILLNSPVYSDTIKKIKVGTLQYGSVNWELDLMKKMNIDTKYNLDVEIVQLASKNAAAVALQGKAVDLIVTDWFWVSRQRSQGRMFSFVPHSMAAGGLIVKKESNIKSLDDINNKKIGIAGGQVDKSWLIFQAYYKKKYGKSLKNKTEQIYGAPPLLNKKIEQGSFDAILTYWPYQARLLANGFEKVIDIKSIISKLGISSEVPIIGWVFRDEFSEDHKKILNDFLESSNETKKIMLESNESWEKIRPIMKAENEDTFVMLREIYKEGIPKNFSKKNIKDASELYEILGNIGGKALIGNSENLASGTFWSN
ncbi:transporter substrate-binding domain-containing protein [Rickettsiales bacterium]|nr:transporter substrate-binding domain-containing protein [Rickettsiales bacterium]